VRVRVREWLVLCRGTGPGLEEASEWADRRREERERERERGVKQIKKCHFGECIPNILVPLPTTTTTTM